MSLVAPTEPAGRELTGKHVLAMMVAFFGIIVTGSIVFTTLAVTSFRGEDVEKSYRQGIDYNRTLESRAAQRTLGWDASVNLVGSAQDRTLLIQIVDAEGTPLTGLSVEAALRHPVDTDLDRVVPVRMGAGGLARADLSGLSGQWTLIASASDGRDRYDFTYPLALDRITG
ncbi:MAG: FixH family protein [Litorimonas sp.]